jgi:hypothetical protein
VFQAGLLEADPALVYWAVSPAGGCTELERVLLAQAEKIARGLDDFFVTFYFYDIFRGKSNFF